MLNRGTVPAFKSQPEIKTILSYSQCHSSNEAGKSIPTNVQFYDLPTINFSAALWTLSRAEPPPTSLSEPSVCAASNAFCGVAPICKTGPGAAGHSPASEPSLAANSSVRPCTAGPTAICTLASPAYPSSFLPFRFSFGEARGDALAFQSFTGSLCVDALAPNPPDVEAKLATSSSWSLWRNSRGEEITCSTACCQSALL